MNWLSTIIVMMITMTSSTYNLTIILTLHYAVKHKETSQKGKYTMKSYKELAQTIHNASSGKYILPAGINVEVLENTYMNTYNKELTLKKLAGDSKVYINKSAKFYIGSITRHPSMSTATRVN